MAHGRLSLFGVGGWELGIGGVIPRKANALKASPSVSSAVVVARQELMVASCTRTAIYAACRSYPLWLTMSLASPREDEREPAALLYDTLLLDHRFST